MNALRLQHTYKPIVQSLKCNILCWTRGEPAQMYELPANPKSYDITLQEAITAQNHNTGWYYVLKGYLPSGQ